MAEKSDAKQRILKILATGEKKVSEIMELTGLTEMVVKETIKILVIARMVVDTGKRTKGRGRPASFYALPSEKNPPPSLTSEERAVLDAVESGALTVRDVSDATGVAQWLVRFYLAGFELSGHLVKRGEIGNIPVYELASEVSKNSHEEWFTDHEVGDTEESESQSPEVDPRQEVLRALRTKSRGLSVDLTDSQQKVLEALSTGEKKVSEIMKLADLTDMVVKGAIKILVIARMVVDLGKRKESNSHPATYFALPSEENPPPPLTSEERAVLDAVESGALTVRDVSDDTGVAQWLVRLYLAGFELSGLVVRRGKIGKFPVYVPASEVSENSAPFLTSDELDILEALEFYRRESYSAEIGERIGKTERHVHSILTKKLLPLGLVEDRGKRIGESKGKGVRRYFALSAKYRELFSDHVAQVPEESESQSPEVDPRQVVLQELRTKPRGLSADMIEGIQPSVAQSILTGWCGDGLLEVQESNGKQFYVPTLTGRRALERIKPSSQRKK